MRFYDIPKGSFMKDFLIIFYFHKKSNCRSINFVKKTSKKLLFFKVKELFIRKFLVGRYER